MRGGEGKREIERETEKEKENELDRKRERGNKICGGSSLGIP